MNTDMNTEQTTAQPSSDVYDNLTLAMTFTQHIASVVKSIDALAERPNEIDTIRDLAKLVHYLADDVSNTIDVELGRLYGSAHYKQILEREEALQ